MFVWNIDPNLFFIGSRGIRYYGILFAFALLGAYWLWLWQTKRGGIAKEIRESFLVWGVVATIVGSRLGHCLFYEPERYLSDPITILYFWEGGLASHGATIGLILALIIFSKINKLRILEIIDRFSFSAAFAAAFVRMGNFMNSEIVGRITDGPIKVKFPRYDRNLLRVCKESCETAASDVCGMINDKCVSFELVPWRHPSQLYEFTMGLLILGILVLVDKIAKKEERPLGLMGGLFLLLYFSARFSVEFFKEYQTLSADESIFTMGQYLSMPFMTLGLVWVIVSLIKRVRTNAIHDLVPVETPESKKENA